MNHNHQNTKIVATVGPACSEYEQLLAVLVNQVVNCSRSKIYELNLNGKAVIGDLNSVWHEISDQLLMHPLSAM